MAGTSLTVQVCCGMQLGESNYYFGKLLLSAARQHRELYFQVDLGGERYLSERFEVSTRIGHSVCSMYKSICMPYSGEGEFTLSLYEARADLNLQRGADPLVGNVMVQLNTSNPCFERRELTFYNGQSFAGAFECSCDLKISDALATARDS